MNKIEFIDMLRRHISEVGDPVFVSDTIDYYQDYIDTAIRKGRTEEDVLGELGDPRLIAKSIVASRDETSEGSYRDADTDDGEYGGYGNTGSGTRRNSGIYDGKLHIVTRRGRDIALPPGLVKVGGAAAAILLLFGAGYVAVQLMPVIGVGILAVLIYRFFKENF